MRDRAKMDQGSNSLFSTFDRIFGAGNWQSVFTNELHCWASVSGEQSGQPKLSFLPFNGSDAVEAGTSAFNATGSSQNDSRFGDIRIGAHRFDGAGRTLAHAYLPPPNGRTAAGDAHFDQAENWVLAPSTSAAVRSGDPEADSELGQRSAGVTSTFFSESDVL